MNKKFLVGLMVLGLIGIFTSSAYAGTYENVTFTVHHTHCHPDMNIDQCIDRLTNSHAKFADEFNKAIMERDQYKLEIMQLEHDHNKQIIDMTNQYNDFKSKQACNIDDYDMMKTDLNSFRDRLTLAEDKVDGYEDAIEYTHVETRQKLDACEVDLLNLINDEVTYVQHEDILHKFNKTDTSTNSTLLINENDLLKKELSSMKLYVTAQNELMLEVIRIFNSNQTVN